MKVIILGAGGTGSYVVPVIQKLLGADSEIYVCDGDKFEAKNMDRQLFSKYMIGRNKAEALAEMYPGGNTYAQVFAVPYFLTDHSVFDDIMPDVIIACPDNHKARLLCLEAADNIVAPVIMCGNEFESAAATLYLPENVGHRTLDPRVRYPEMLEGAASERSRVGCQGAVQEENKQLVVANMGSAFFAASMFYGLCKSKDSPEDREFMPGEIDWGLYKTYSTSVDGLRAQAELLTDA